MLAVVTNENVKIYDFARDIISPLYNFKVLASSFVDCTFVYDQAGLLHLLALTAEGAVFVQSLTEQVAAAAQGEVYMFDELYLGQVNGKPLTGNGVCLDFSPPTESLFMTLQTAPSFVVLCLCCR